MNPLHDASPFEERRLALLLRTLRPAPPAWRAAARSIPERVAAHPPRVPLSSATTRVAPEAGAQAGTAAAAPRGERPR